MKLIVNPHKIEIAQNEAINEKEIDISICEFEFAEEITNEYVKEAYFTFEGNTYKQIIVNNECLFPSEVLVKKGMIEIGVVAYLTENEEEIKRYNPSPVFISTLVGSLKDNPKNSEPITPSEMEQYEQALNDGLNAISEVIENAERLDIDATKTDNVATITITKQDGTTKEVEVLDGEAGEKGQDGADGKDAKINGVNTLNIVAGSNITLNQTDDTLEISSTDTTDYTELSNKPKINNEELIGNKSLSDLGINIPDVSNFITKEVDDLTNYYKKSETYTKTEVDSKVSSVYKYKGTVQTYQDLPSENLTIGDVYNVESDGSNYAWTGTVWDKLGGDIDLSGYQTKIDSTHKLSSDLVDDTNNTHLFVSSSEKQTWNNKSDFSGDYTDLTNKPTIPTVPTNVSAFTNDAGYLTQHQDISGKENITNKVTSMSVSSTDTEYPSAKCVYEAMQSAGGNVDMGQYIIKTNSTSDVFVFEGKKAGIYTFNTKYDDGNFFYKILNSDSSYSVKSIGQTLQLCLYEDFDYDNAPNNYTFGYIYNKTTSGSVTRRYIKKDNSFIQNGYTEYYIVLTNGNQTFTGTKTFSTIPKQSDTTAPTQNAQFTNKKYVDDSISNSLGDVETLLGGI